MAPRELPGSTPTTRPLLLALVALMLVAMSTAGCLDSVRDRLPGAFGEPEPRAAFSFAETRAIEPRAGAIAHDVPVDALTSRILVEAELGSTMPVAIAEVVVAVALPNGTIVQQFTLTPNAPSGSISVDSFPVRGPWSVDVTARGVGGNGQGATYTLRIDETLVARS